MAAESHPPVMIDTSVWISAFRGDQEVPVPRIKDLLVSDRVRICGPVLFELKRGMKTHEAKKILPLLAAVRAVDFQSLDWERAGELDAGLRKNGVTIPPMDVLIAHVCIVEELCLWSLDQHFKKVPRLILFTP